MKKVLMFAIGTIAVVAVGALIMHNKKDGDERPKIPIDKIDTSGAADKL